MVEAFAVASGKGARARRRLNRLRSGWRWRSPIDATVVDADTGMANLLFHAGLFGGERRRCTTCCPETRPSRESCYDRSGMTVVPRGTSLDGFRDADPARLRAVVAELAADTDVILLDSAAALSSRSAILPVVLADCVVVVLQPTIPSPRTGSRSRSTRVLTAPASPAQCSTRCGTTTPSVGSPRNRSGTSTGRRWRRCRPARRPVRPDGRAGCCWPTPPTRTRRRRSRRRRPASTSATGLGGRGRPLPQRRRPGPAMNLPDGRLLKSCVVSDPRYPILAEALDRNLTGYAVPEPQETLLLEGEGRASSPSATASRN